MRSNVLSALCTTVFSPLAHTLYYFLKIINSLPSEKEVVSLFKEHCDDLNSYGHAINSYFIDHVNHLMLSVAPDYFKTKAESLIKIEKSLDNNNSAHDFFSISFCGVLYEAPLIQELLNIHSLLSNFDFERLSEASQVNALNLVLPSSEVNKLMERIAQYTGLFISINSSNYHSECTYILDLGLFRSLSQTARCNDIRLDYIEIRKLISKYQDDSSVDELNPDFLILFSK